MFGSVSIIARNIVSATSWKNGISNILEGMTVNAFTADRLKPGDNYSDDLIIIFPPSLKKSVLPCLDPNAKYIIGKRTLSLGKIYQLADIPAGSRVIILNDTYEFCQDIKDELISLGFDYFDYYLYNPSTPPTEKFKYAITCGEGWLLPDVEHYIDFGSRQLSMSTVAEVLSHFNMGPQLDNYILNRYVFSLNSTSISLYSETIKNAALRRQLEAVISEFDEGIILFNKQLEILSYNTKSATILKETLDNSNFLQKTIPPKWDFNEYIECFVSKDDIPLHMSLKPLSITGEKMFMATISDMSKLHDIEEKYKRHQENNGLNARYSFKDIFYQSEVMSSVVSTAKKYSRSDSNVLVMGESGTGKELFAQAIHNASPRKDGPFVAINCGALSSDLLESELFGYEAGAFTGALKGGKSGLFETAHKGTLFLDEIADAPLPVQQKLLRALQEKEIFRVSGTKPIFVDVRIISATNKNILSEVAKGAFRQDLFYRINVLTLRIPPLRERGADVFNLFHFLLSLSLKKARIPFPESQLDHNLNALLQKHSWPGNIREMVNLVEIVTNGLTLERNYNIAEQIQQYWHMMYHSDEDNPLIMETFPSIDGLPAAKLQMHELTRQVFLILAELERDGKVPGRSAVYRYCQAHNIPLTEQQIKLRINRLRELGMLCSTGGYGSIITQQGYRYLNE